MADRDPERCPSCGSDLRAGQIPEEDLTEQDRDGEPRYYVRTIGVVVPGVYDGVLHWQCPICGCRWHRWARGSELRRRCHYAVVVHDDPGLWADVSL